MIASKGNFDLLLRLDQVGTSIDSIDQEISLRVFLRGFECQGGRWGFKGFREASTQ